MKHSIQMGAAALVLSFAGAVFAADNTTMKPATPAITSSPFATLDTNKDGRLSQAEIRANVELSGSFATLDTDSDTYLSQTEYGKWSDPANAGKGNPARSPDSSTDRTGADKPSPMPAQ